MRDDRLRVNFNNWTQVREQLEKIKKLYGCKTYTQAVRLVLDVFLDKIDYE